MAAREEFEVYDGELVVIETEERAYIGTLNLDGDTAVLHTGIAGHPPRVDLADVETVTRAEFHPDVEVI